MRSFILLGLALTGALPVHGSEPSSLAASANYTIAAATIDAGGVNSSSASYRLRGSAVGEFAAANQIPITGGPYALHEGYVGQLSDVLVRATSRLTHGAAGVFDVNLPLTGLLGIEPRSSNTYAVVFTFASPLLTVQSVSASATGPVQPGPSSGMIDPGDSHNYIATLSALPNAQRITVSLGNVNDADGNFTATLPATMGLLIGDSNADGFVNSGDATITRNRSGQTTDASNFRADYNIDGSINSADATIVRARSGQFLP